MGSCRCCCLNSLCRICDLSEMNRFDFESDFGSQFHLEVFTLFFFFFLIHLSFIGQGLFFFFLHICSRRCIIFHFYIGVGIVFHCIVTIVVIAFFVFVFVSIVWRPYPQSKFLTIPTRPQHPVCRNKDVVIKVSQTDLNALRSRLDNFPHTNFIHKGPEHNQSKKAFVMRTSIPRYTRAVGDFETSSVSANDQPNIHEHTVWIFQINLVV
mmetsp:Transcript_10999/g.26001  ORF Transcript_10999/g.26001 Transcript_10999/m.26001 type:complete len:210 (+) Transcript_10999:505-1134(+)